MHNKSLTRLHRLLTVLAFAGDALICVFASRSASTDNELDDILQLEDNSNLKNIDGCFRALHCANILRKVNLFDLSTHIGISYGDMKLSFLGGHNGMWSYIVNGQCFSELSACIEDATTQNVVLTSACYYQLLTLANSGIGVGDTDYPDIKMSKIGTRGNYLFEQFSGSSRLAELLNHAGRVSFISKLIQGTAIKPSPILPLMTNLSQAESIHLSPSQNLKMLPRKQSARYIGIRMGSIDDMLKSKSHSETDKDLQLVEALSQFVPLPVLNALRSEFNHQIGELRTVTTMFLSLDSYNPVANADPSSLQPFFLIAQQVMAETGGFMRQFLVDDKGCVLIVMWGVPTYTYANNCSRALYCAKAIHQRIQEIGHRCSIGITTGAVFCGTIGAAERCDYVGIGNEVNLAARFMSKALGRILLDDDTFDNLNEENRNLLGKGETLQLKGMKDRQPYIFTAVDAMPTLSNADDSHLKSKLLRKKIMQFLEKQLDKITNSLPPKLSPKDLRQAFLMKNRSKRAGMTGNDVNQLSNVHFSILCGPAGSGKGTAAEYFRLAARTRGIQTIQIRLQTKHKTIPYGLLKDLFMELVGDENFCVPEKQDVLVKRLAHEAFPDEPENARDAQAMLKTMLGLGSSANSSPDVVDDGQITSLQLSTYQMENSPIESLHKSRGSPQFHDIAFYKILVVLLKETPTALIIEDAHYCDELSWSGLYLLLVGVDLDMVVLLTIRNNSDLKLKNAHSKSMSRENLHGLGSPKFSATAKKRSTFRFQESYRSLLNKTTSDLEAGALEKLESHGLEQFSFGLFRSIVAHPNCTITEMKGLSEDEVKSLLMQILKVDSISNHLVKLVLDASSGNLYWCRNIALFIKEHGIQHLEEALFQSPTQIGRASSLKALIICRWELLDVDAQRVLKYASVVGMEFTMQLIRWILPQLSKHTDHRKSMNVSTMKSLMDIFDSLERHGFIYCIMESPELIYGFENELLQKTLYELIPPRYTRPSETNHKIAPVLVNIEFHSLLFVFYTSDTAEIHAHVCSFMEKEYKENLRPFYPSLGYHYRMANQRSKAFKYEVKSAALAISSGAYNDALLFSESAFDLAEVHAELKMLADVIDRAIGDLAKLDEPIVNLRNISRSFYSMMQLTDMEADGGGGGDDDISIAEPYALNKAETEAACLEEFYDLRNQVEVILRRMEGSMEGDLQSTINEGKVVLSQAEAELQGNEQDRQMASQLSWKVSFKSSSTSTGGGDSRRPSNLLSIDTLHRDDAQPADLHVHSTDLENGAIATRSAVLVLEASSTIDSQSMGSEKAARSAHSMSPARKSSYSSDDDGGGDHKTIKSPTSSNPPAVRARSCCSVQ